MQQAETLFLHKLVFGGHWPAFHEQQRVIHVPFELKFQKIK
jgi:hypothetical protein